ncbi:hypothetical protein KSD_27460 [Ktedonobacter sp. SOSP1-85]|nr:hypothetical protein KSD_27460 [Ktedonobacter sp. SOSP1-85]
MFLAKPRVGAYVSSAFSWRMHLLSGCLEFDVSRETLGGIEQRSRNSMLEWERCRVFSGAIV